MDSSSSLILENTTTVLGGDSINYTVTANENEAAISSKSMTETVFWYLHLYLTPVIIVVGFVGNGLSFVVFVKTRLRHLSSSVYLAALCVADTLFLIQLLALWLIYVRVFIYHKEGFCQLFVYISYVSSFLSVWFVVSFTVERYIVCIYPLRKQSICSVWRARAVVIAITFFAAIAYNFGAWTSGTVPHQKGRMCIPLNKFRSIIFILNNVDTFVTLIVPSILIIFMNFRIVLKLSKLSSERSKLLGHDEDESGSFYSRKSTISVTTFNGGLVQQQKAMIHKSQLKITKMLVSVSSIFVVLNLPSHMIRVYIALVDLFTDYKYDPPENIALTQQAFYYIYYTNFAVNFFLYSLCGQNFRIAVKELFTKRRNQQKSEMSTKITHNPLLEMSSAGSCYEKKNNHSTSVKRNFSVSWSNKSLLSSKS